MEISRILRVLITIIIVAALFVIVIASYRHEQMVNSMIELSDASSSIVTRLSTDRLAWTDAKGNQHQYVLDEEKFDNLSYIWTLGGEDYASQVSIAYGEGLENEIGPYGSGPPQDRMTSALRVPVALKRGGKKVPAQLRVIVWRS